MARTTQEKFNTVIQKNTFYFFNKKFEEQYEGHINALKESLLVLKNDVDTQGCTEDLFEKFLKDNENGLRALLALTGFSNESLKRLVTLIRVVNDAQLASITLKDKWHKAADNTNIKEWSDKQIAKMVKENEFFRRGLVNLFFKGATVPFLAKTLPLFDLKKLSISKLQFDISAMIDTLVRYKEKGSYSGKKGNNPETVIESILDELEISHETGDLNELVENESNQKRTMDFIIPDKKSPLIIAESSFLVTTSSGQGDKSKTEIAVGKLIKKHYPHAKFIGFVDGIGWYVRKEDLKRMVDAYDDVFTFHPDELERFKKLLSETFKDA
ncbi:MAG: hypothetical protein D6694_00820 [Gammaproteobacteria bacterium]|nr:MAG: hypothetical protein D6694_00820 [Gammaproteobacteria bacterium]